MLHEDRSRAESFGAAAERYDRTRPTYPPALIDAIVGSGAPDNPPLEVLDVGCGTGIASRLMAGRGARVLGVEIDDRMAEIARAGGIEVEVASFEAWNAKSRTFDRVTAGQAWHWLDPIAGPEKAASLLRTGGKLMPFWNIADAPAEVRAVLEPIYSRIAPAAHSISVQTGHVTATRYGNEIDGIRACDSLTEPTIERFPWSQTYTREQWLDLLPTHSDHAILPADVLARLLDEVGAAIDGIGGSFEMAYRTLLISATRI